MKTNFPIIHSLRGLTAIGICLYHYICCTVGYINGGIIFDAVHMLSNTVQIFFIISGMVIPISMIIGNYQYKHFFTFLWKRTLRIEPPYIVSMVVGMVYLWVRNFVPGSAPVDLFPTWQEVLLHLGYLIPFFENMRWINPGYWTLAIEFQYYLILALIFPLAMSSQLLFRGLFYFILLAMPFAYTDNDCFTGWGAYFLLGLIYILHYFKRVSLAEFVTVSIAASAITLVHHHWVILAIAWGTILLVYFFQDWENKFTHFFGNISYSFYLLHSVVGASIINFLSHRFTIWWEKPLVIAIGFLASTIAAHYYFQWIEKPSMGWSKKIKYNR